MSHPKTRTSPAAPVPAPPAISAPGERSTLPGAAQLPRLFHRRWAAPILAELDRCNGCKLVWLTHRLGAARQPVRDALDALIAMRLVEPNPGYGHPLRPEYILTPVGAGVAPAAAALVAALERAEALDVGLRKWAVPTIAAVRAGAHRFTQLAGVLPSATDRALAQTLRALVARQLLSRTRATDERVLYRCTPAGRAIATPGARLGSRLSELCTGAPTTHVV